MGLSAHLSERLSTRTSTTVPLMSPTPLSVYSFFNFAYVLRMSWCACGLDILHFFHLMDISIFGILDAVKGSFL